MLWGTTNPIEEKQDCEIDWTRGVISFYVSEEEEDTGSQNSIVDTSPPSVNFN